MHLKIGDLGLVRDTGSMAINFAGTFNTMAPEVAFGAYTGAVDIWSLGAVFDELLTANSIFDGVSSFP